MSALTEKVAREHRHMISPRLRGYVCECHEWQQRGDGLFDEESFVAHVAEVTEAAVRAAVADEIDSVGHYWSGAPARAFFALATDIREGKQP